MLLSLHSLDWLSLWRVVVHKCQSVGMQSFEDVSVNLLKMLYFGSIQVLFMLHDTVYLHLVEQHGGKADDCCYQHLERSNPVSPIAHSLFLFSGYFFGTHALSTHLLSNFFKSNLSNQFTLYVHSQQIQFKRY